MASSSDGKKDVKVSRRGFLAKAVAGAGGTAAVLGSSRLSFAQPAAAKSIKIPDEFAAAARAPLPTLEFPMTGAQIFARACKELPLFGIRDSGFVEVEIRGHSMKRQRRSDIVRSVLQAYADHGVFRGFSEQRGRSGRHEFKFLWLTPRPIQASYDPGARTLTFRNLLANLPARSSTYADLRQFIAHRSNGGIPTHRRIDPRRVRALCVNRSGSVSIALKGRPNQERYVVNRGVNLVNEIFIWLHESYADYMWQTFNLPQE